MKNNTRVTNKMLQEKLDNLLKANKHPKYEETVKTSRVKNLYRQSSAFYLWLITGVLGYAHKLPIVRNILAALSLWYGRTTWWRMLIMLRKAFITFNAIIGMYMVYKTTGFGMDNLLVGFTAMGENYVNIFWNFNKRIFNWLYDLFDHKVIPNLPGNPPSNPTSWFSNKIEKPSWFSGPYNNINPEISNNTGLESLRKTYMEDLFNKSVNINITSWYKDITTWVWIGGTLVSVGFFYVGYKIFMDPLFINYLPIIGNWFKSTTPAADIVNAATVTVTSPNGSITPTNAAQATIVDPSSSSVTKSIVKSVVGGFKKLNPATWFLSSVDYEAQKAVFEHAQTNFGYDNRFYPFKEIHPYDSWLKRMRINLFGESVFERTTRRAIKRDILLHLIPPLNVTPPIIPSTPIINSNSLTPIMATVGLGLNLTNMDPGFMSVASKLSSVTNTPTHLPISLPDMNVFNNPVEEAIERLKGHVSPEVTNPVIESTASAIKSSVITAPVTSPVVEAIATITSVTPIVESSGSKVIIDNLTPKTFADVVNTPVANTTIPVVTAPVTTISVPVNVPVEISPLNLNNKFSVLDDLDDTDLYNNLKF